MTFGQNVLRLVLGDAAPANLDPAPAAAPAPALAPATATTPAPAAVISAAPVEAASAGSAGPESEQLGESGFADIEAAVALVSAGLAARVVLTSFQTWPGLLWRAYQLAEEANVLILPTVVRPGGLVDIVVAREKPND